MNAPVQEVQEPGLQRYSCKFDIALNLVAANLESVATMFCLLNV